MLTSAPAAINASIHLSLSFLAANIRAVSPLLFCVFTSAPAWIRMLTHVSFLLGQWLFDHDYRPQRMGEGYVFTGVCLSTGSVPGLGGVVHGPGGVPVPRGVPGPGGLVSQHALRQTPRKRWLQLRTVRILLECILVILYVHGSSCIYQSFNVLMISTNG